MRLAMEWGDRIPVGLIYRNDRPSFEEHIPVLKDGPLIGRSVDRSKLASIMETYV
jgi:2-oxoglutarate ferredoxin oxidoreductase subunit beta